MFNFTIFRIPVAVEPMFWLMAFIFGGGLSVFSSGDPLGSLIAVGVWIVALFISILVHELGHALISRKVGGATVWIRLTAMCGLAYSQGGNMTKHQRAFMSVMGPGAGFLLLIAIYILSVLVIGPSLTWDTFLYSNFIYFTEFLGKFGLSLPYSDFELLKEFIVSPVSSMKFHIFSSFFMINFFWGMINLMPVLPLDGGHIINEYIRSPRRVYLISAVTAVVVGFAGIYYVNNVFLALIFGFFAFRNFTAYSAAKY